MDLNYVLGRDLNPHFRVLFSMYFPGEFPSGWKPVEVRGSKCVVNCGRSTYKFSMCFDDFRLSTGM
jgi:hypothetical protein